MAASVLYLVIRVGGDGYLLAASQVVEILPLVRLKLLPGAPIGTAGLMNYRGSVIPVIDLSLVSLGAPTQSAGATRIVVVHFAAGADMASGTSVGLLVSAARDTLRVDPTMFASGGLTADGAPYVGPVLATPDGVMQLVDASALMTPQLREALSRASEAA